MSNLADVPDSDVNLDPHAMCEENKAIVFWFLYLAKHLAKAFNGIFTIYNLFSNQPVHKHLIVFIALYILSTAFPQGQRGPWVLVKSFVGYITGWILKLVTAQHPLRTAEDVCMAIWGEFTTDRGFNP